MTTQQLLLFPDDDPPAERTTAFGTTAGGLRLPDLFAAIEAAALPRSPSWDRRRAAIVDIAPYHIRPFEPEPDRRLLLNREYKPLGHGLPYFPCVDYETFRDSTAPARALDMDACTAEPDLRARPRDGYLFGDGNPPWCDPGCLREYLAALRVLFRFGHGATP